MSATFTRLLNSETGPKTVHFWAPVLKWALVFAGISDAQRPVEKVSGTQNLSLIATGLIWTRWSFVIKPKNYLLASVNFFLTLTSGYQLFRITNYRLAEGDSVGQVLSYIAKGSSTPSKVIENTTPAAAASTSSPIVAAAIESAKK